MTNQFIPFIFIKKAPLDDAGWQHLNNCVLSWNWVKCVILPNCVDLKVFPTQLEKKDNSLYFISVENSTNPDIMYSREILHMYCGDKE